MAEIYNRTLKIKITSRRHNDTTYVYSAAGLKVKKMFGSTATDYLDGFQYANSVLQLLPTAEGFYDFTQSQYIYQYKDQLGNVRVSFVKQGNTAVVTENNNYYPFGLRHSNSTVTNSYKDYKYNGKELQETGFVAMDLRHYMPDIGRFSSGDALAELMPSNTPYHFTTNNPVYFSDPTGLWTEINGGVSTDRPEEIAAFMDYFKNGGSVNGVDNLLQQQPFAKEIELDGVNIKGRGSGFGSNLQVNRELLGFGIDHQKSRWNLQMSYYTAGWDFQNSPAAQSVAKWEMGIAGLISAGILAPALPAMTPYLFSGGSAALLGTKASVSAGLQYAFTKDINLVQLGADTFGTIGVGAILGNLAHIDILASTGKTFYLSSKNQFITGASIDLILGGRLWGYSKLGVEKGIGHSIIEVQSQILSQGINSGINRNENK